MIKIGLTGSIGMGKSTTADMFATRGVPVWDADAAVHRLYQPGGAAVAPIADAFPDVVDASGVNRDALKRLISADHSVLSRIEAIVHPLVAADRQAFAARCEDAGARMILFDIPLLFETRGDTAVDLVVVVSVPSDVQRKRVLARPGMTESQFNTILAKQLPDSEKRARADVVIDTQTLETAAAGVDRVIEMARGIEDA